MNKELTKLKNLLKLCHECEQWTLGVCALCEISVCDDCEYGHNEVFHDESEEK